MVEEEQFGSSAPTPAELLWEEETHGSHRLYLPAWLSQRSSHGDGDYVTT